MRNPRWGWDGSVANLVIIRSAREVEGILNNKD